MGASPALRSALADAARSAEGPVVGLTAKQMRLLDFVKAEIEAGRPAPSFNEMGAFLGVRSRATLHAMVCRLVERGNLVRLPGRARALALPDRLPVIEKPATAVDPVAPGPLISAKTADWLNSYAARKGASSRVVLADALAEYMVRHP